MLPDVLAACMENFKQLYAMIQKLQSIKMQEMGQILFVKKVPFHKNSHIYQIKLELKLRECALQLYFLHI